MNKISIVSKTTLYHCFTNNEQEYFDINKNNILSYLILPINRVNSISSMYILAIKNNSKQDIYINADISTFIYTQDSNKKITTVTNAKKYKVNTTILSKNICYIERFVDITRKSLNLCIEITINNLSYVINKLDNNIEWNIDQESNYIYVPIIGAL